MIGFNYLTMTDIILWPEVIKLMILSCIVGVVLGAVIISIGDMVRVVMGVKEVDE